MGVSESEESSMLLDEKLLRFMEQLELLEEKRASLNALIEQGWFSMSKARYSMGNKHVSPLQYASEMEPLVLVHAKTLDSGELYFSTERLEQKCIKEVGADSQSIEEIGPQEEGVRRRIKPKEDIIKKEVTEETSHENAPEETPVRKSNPNLQRDPLKWFGILVPQSLKHAQLSFKQVLELSAEIATLQAAVLSTRQELKHSKMDQHILQQEASATHLDKVAD